MPKARASWEDVVDMVTLLSWLVAVAAAATVAKEPDRRREP